MSEHSIEIDAARDGQTVSAIVRELLACPWSRARDLCASGRVHIDGAMERDGARRVRRGMRIEVSPDSPRRTEGVLPREDLVHVDADVVVVRKPAGVMTVPYEDGDKDTLIDRVRTALKRIEKARIQNRGGGSRDLMVGAVQRLDKDTTGLLVFARNMPAKRALEEQLRTHSMLRRYLAIAHGTVRDATWDTMLVQDRGDGLRGSWGSKPFHAVKPRPPDAKRAVTHVRALEVLDGATLCECRLETGRQHQIRIHLSESGHMLVGEPVYLRDHMGPKIPAPRPMLHATELGFVHPRTGEEVRWEDPAPADFEQLLRVLRRR